ncbi:MAG: glycosyltransferase family 4 protein [Caldilineales bacterium]
MRIAMLSKAVVVAAYQRKLEELARLPDVELAVIAPPSWRDSRGETRLQHGFTAGYELITTPIARNGHFHTHFYPRLGPLLTSLRPDLLHIDEEPYNLATWQALRWAVAARCPALFFTWQNIRRTYPPPFGWMESFCYRHSAYAIAGNEDARQVLMAKGFGGPSAVIPQFGVDPELFRRQAQPPLVPPDPTGGFTIGYAGGLVAEKGLDDLLRAVALATRFAVQPWRLLLAGEGPQQAALQALAGQLGIGTQVTFLGRSASTTMPAFYASLDVLVLPSRTTPTWREQFGRVLIEAMACETAVIGSDSGEIPHVIGDAGMTYPEGNIEALAARLVHLIGDPTLRHHLAQQGRARVLAHFTQQRIAQATWQVYRAVVTAPTP